MAMVDMMRYDLLAKAAGIEVMAGCLDECELGISEGLHFALAKPNIIYADLNGHIRIIGDPTTGSVRIKEGILYPNGKSGLGFSF
jgi:L-alanine-DL-glutamate epimerase-like enolase superfamily enzyme